MSNSLADGDPLLRPLRQSQADEREDLIARILVAHARPIVDAMLRSAFARPLPPEDSADLESEIILRLVQRLSLVAETPGAAAIGDFASYVRTVTHHAIEDHRRRLQPARTRLANRVRYVLTHDRRVALWENGGAVCGLAAWVGRPALRTAESSVAAERGAPEVPPANAPTTTAPTRLRALVHTALAAAPGPMAFDQLVAILAHALAIGDELVPCPASEQAPADDPADRLIARDYLARAWAEIVALPLRQRQALLLHLRFDDGESVARELPALGLADVRSIAQVLGMPLAELLELWNALPLEDLRIATLLGLTRQQVINLRKSARERLARRMQRV